VISVRNEFTIVTGTQALELMIEILNRYDVGRLGFNGEPYPYVIPMNHAYYEGKLLLHGSYKGRKIDLIKTNPLVCYEVDGPKDGLSPDDRSCHQEYESVLCYGRIREVDNVEDKRLFLSLVNQRFDKPALKHGDLERCNAFVIDIHQMTGRTGRFRPTGERPLYIFDFEQEG